MLVQGQPRSALDHWARASNSFSSRWDHMLSCEVAVFLQGQQQSAEPASLGAMVNLCIELQNFAPVLQPVKLRPGPPISLHMSPGHPFREQVYTLALTRPFLHVISDFYSLSSSTSKLAHEEAQVLP